MVSKTGDGFHAFPKCWVFEPTYGWLNYYRDLSRDYEDAMESSEPFVSVAMIEAMAEGLRNEDF